MEIAYQLTSDLSSLTQLLCKLKRLHLLENQYLFISKLLKSQMEEISFKIRETWSSHLQLLITDKQLVLSLLLECQQQLVEYNNKSLKQQKRRNPPL